MNLAIIPARGGSKGIPRKNLRLLNDKPLIVYSIEQALNSGVIDRVLVSTDDVEISQVAWGAGAEVIPRPSEISGDKAPSELALLHCLDFLRRTGGVDPDLVVFLQATSPLRRAEDIREAVATLQQQQADSLFSACPLQGFLWRMEDGRPEAFNYDHHCRPMRQDAPEDLVENGSIYVFKPWVLRHYQNRLGGKIAVYRMRGLHYFQIDDDGDFEILEALLRKHCPATTRGACSLADVRLLVLDFDGVLTDNTAYVDEGGRESVRVSRADGHGLAELLESGIEVVVLSSEVNSVVAARCRKLGIGFTQGLGNRKAEALEELVRERALEWRHVAYAGNDVNDLACMERAGVALAVADAVEEVRARATLVTARPGGHGAVREICDQILKERREVACVQTGMDRESERRGRKSRLRDRGDRVEP
jgi:N-acylneuraminate cytidylyltransferase